MVDLHHAINLVEETLKQAKIAASDASNGSGGFDIGKIVEVELQSKLLPFMLQDELHLLRTQRLEVMNKAHP